MGNPIVTDSGAKALTYDADGRIDRVHMTTEGVHGAGPARLV